MANRVVHFEFAAEDSERARKFYEKTFGWEIKQWEGTDHWMIKTGPEEVPGIDGSMMLRAENPKTGQEKAYFCTISVDDIDGAMTTIKTSGGKIIVEKIKLDGVGWLAAAEDTEGNKFGLMQGDEQKS